MNSFQDYSPFYVLLADVVQGKVIPKDQENAMNASNISQEEKMKEVSSDPDAPTASLH